MPGRQQGTANDRSAPPSPECLETQVCYPTQWLINPPIALLFTCPLLISNERIGNCSTGTERIGACATVPCESGWRDRGMQAPGANSVLVFRCRYEGRILILSSLFPQIRGSDFRKKWARVSGVGLRYLLSVVCASNKKCPDLGRGRFVRSARRPSIRRTPWETHKTHGVQR